MLLEFVPVALSGQHSFVPLLCEDESFLGPADSRLEILQHPLTEPEEVVDIEGPFGGRRLVLELGLQLVVVDLLAGALEKRHEMCQKAALPTIS